MAKLHYRDIIEAYASREGTDVNIRFNNPGDTSKSFKVIVTAGCAFMECSDGFQDASLAVRRGGIADMVGTVCGDRIEDTVDNPTDWVMMVISEYMHA